MQEERVGSGALPGLPTRLAQVFFSPSAVFEKLKYEPVWLGALLVGSVVVALANAAIPAELYEQTIREQTIQAGGEIPDDVGQFAQIAKWASVIGAPVFWTVIAVVGCAVNLLVFKVLFGYQATFRQYFSATSHALFITALGAVLLAPLRVVTQNAQLMLTAGALLPVLEEGFFARFLGYLDLFNVWVAVVFGIAAAVVDGRKGAGPSVGISLGVSCLIAVIMATLIR